jgi:peroxiredoxin
VWLDASAGGYPRRIEQRRIDPRGLGANLTVESIEFDTVENATIPIAAHIHGDIREEIAHQITVDADFRRKNIDFRPNFKSVGAFKMIAPADYPVINHAIVGGTWKLVDGIPVLADPNASTRPAPSLSPDVQAVMDQIEATSRKLRELVPSQQILSEPDFRRAHAPELMALLQRNVNLVSQLQALERGLEDPGFIRMKYQSLGILAALGDPSATGQFANNAGLQGDAQMAKAALALGQWWLNCHDSAAQTKVLAEFAEIARANPSSDEIASALVAMSQSAATEELSQRARQLIRSTMSESVASRFAAEDEAVARQKKMIGKPLTISGTSITGQMISTADLKGKVVLVQFWATWCSGCLAEIPHLQDVFARYHARGLEIVGISRDASDDSLAAFVKKEAIPWSQIRLPTTSIEELHDPLEMRWNVRSIPTIFIIDKAGTLRYIDGTQDTEDRIKALLDEAP